MVFCSKIVVVGCAFALGMGLSFAGTRQMENLGRGLTVSNAGTGVFVSFRLLGTDLPTATFTLFRDGAEVKKFAAGDATQFYDAKGSVNSVYTLKDASGRYSKTAVVLPENFSDRYGKAAFKSIKLDVPKNLTMPDNSTCSYTPNDMSVGDLDGDGEYELVVKWDPSNSHDNSQSGYTGNVYIDAYKLDGKKLWRIDLGKNIRAGAHYTQFMVYDLDGDGISEVAMKTGDGTIDGTGKVIGDASIDNRDDGGRIMKGNEYLTVFNGSTGAAITTIDYVPNRNVQAQSKTNGWGDNYANRSERMLAAIAYLDGVHPSLIMCRGYYTMAYVVAYDFDGKTLKQKWYSKNETDGKGLYGEGNHNISVGDVDGDGYDEIVFGSAALNHDGSYRYTTGFGHGDAMHLSDLDPDKPGLELWDVHEEKSAKYSDEMRDNKGNVIFGTLQKNVDNGRGLAADIDSTSRGFEMWSSNSDGIYTIKGSTLSTKKPSINFRLYWDGDLQDELFDVTGSSGGGKIEKWNSSTKSIDRAMNVYSINNSTTNNSTKGNPCLSADIFGDWREELIMRSSTDPSIVNIISTITETPYRVYTLMHDAHYRVSIAWQNVAYNQPPHLGYYLPDNVGKNLKQPNIYLANADRPDPVLQKTGAGSSSQNIEIGSEIASFGYNYNYCSSVEVVGLPAGVNATLESGKVTISGAPTVPGKFDFTVKTVGGNIEVILKGTINVSGVGSSIDASVAKVGAGWSENSNSGFAENGYYNFENTDSSFATYKVYSKNASEAVLTVRFANGGANARNMALNVNENYVQDIAMSSTGAWTNWKLSSAKVNLNAGENTITLKSISADGGANIDMFYFDIEGVSLTENLTTALVANKISQVHYNANMGVFVTPKAGFAEVSLFDLNGTLRMSITKNMQVGANSLVIDKSALPHGMYTLKVKLSNKLVYKTRFNNF